MIGLLLLPVRVTMLLEIVLLFHCYESIVVLFAVCTRAVSCDVEYARHTNDANRSFNWMNGVTFAYNHADNSNRGQTRKSQATSNNHNQPPTHPHTQTHTHTLCSMATCGQSPRTGQFSENIPTTLKSPGSMKR